MEFAWEEGVLSAKILDIVSSTHQDIESRLSYAYLHAVVSHAGMVCRPATPDEDKEGIDAVVTAYGAFPGTTMKHATSISPTDLRDYAKLRGWTLVPEAIRDRLYVLNHPHAKFRQLIVPMDAGRPDYGDAVRVAIEGLSEFEHRGPSLVEASLLEAGSDTWRFAVSSLRQEDEGLPLGYATLALKGVETALRAAASSEVQPRAFHPKLNGLEARQLACRELAR